MVRLLSVLSVHAGGYQRSRLAYIRRRCPDPLRIELAMLVDSLADETGDTESVKALNQWRRFTSMPLRGW